MRNQKIFHDSLSKLNVYLIKSIYFTRRTRDIRAKIPVKIVRIDFPQQTLDFLFDFPFPVYRNGDDGGAEQKDAQSSCGDDTALMSVVFCAEFVVEPTGRFVVRFPPAWPIGSQTGRIQFVLLKEIKFSNDERDSARRRKKFFLASTKNLSVALLGYKVEKPTHSLDNHFAETGRPEPCDNRRKNFSRPIYVVSARGRKSFPQNHRSDLI